MMHTLHARAFHAPHIHDAQIVTGLKNFGEDFETYSRQTVQRKIREMTKLLKNRDRCFDVDAC